MENKLHCEDADVVPTSIPTMDTSVELHIVTDPVLTIKITTIPMMEPNVSRLFSSIQVTRSKITCTYFMEISGHHVFVKDNAVQHLKQLHDQGLVAFPVTFTQEKPSYLKNVQQNLNKASNTKLHGLTMNSHHQI